MKLPNLAQFSIASLWGGFYEQAFSQVLLMLLKQNHLPF